VYKRQILVVAAPKKEYGAAEVKSIRQFIETPRGSPPNERYGTAVFILEPGMEERPGRPVIPETGLEDLLREYGVVVDRTVVLDPARQIPGMGATVFGADGRAYGNHQIVEVLGGKATLWVSARSLSTLDDERSPLGVTSLVTTSEASWGESDISPWFNPFLQPRFDEDKDTKGPVAIAMAVSPQPMQPGGPTPPGPRLVVFGDGDFVINELIQPGVANQDLFINALYWLIDRSYAMGIEPKEIDKPLFNVSKTQSTLVLLGGLLLAVLSIVVGAAVWIIRR